MNRMEHHTRWSQVDTVAIERAKGIFVCVCVLSTVLLNEHPRLFFLQIAFSEDTDYTPRPTFAASTPCPCTRLKSTIMSWSGANTAHPQNLQLLPPLLPLKGVKVP